MKPTVEMPAEWRRRNGKVPQVIGTRASEVATRPVEWLWDKRIPKGKLTMFDGDPDVGKSVITIHLRSLRRSVSHSSLRKIMHATACYMSCMHHVSASRPPLRPVRPRVCEMLDTNFAEFLFHTLR